MTTQDTTVHVIGRCPVRGCKNRRRNTLAATVTTDRYGTRTEYAIPSVDPLYTKGVSATPIHGTRPSSPDYTQNRHEVAQLASLRAAGWVCEAHDRFMRQTVVRGAVNLEKACDGRCMAATGGDCECACGGELHGATYDMA